MILSHKEIEEIAAAVTEDFNEFFFGSPACQAKCNIFLYFLINSMGER